MEELNNKDKSNEYIYGRNTVLEAIKAGKTINKIYIQKGITELIKYAKQAREEKLVVIEVEKQKLDEMVQRANHQGIVANVTEFEYSDIDEIIEYAKSRNEAPFVLILDGIEDVHNLGAIIRIAECSNVHGIVIPKRNSAVINGTVEKVAAGATAYMKVARVPNLVDAIKRLKDHGLWFYALDMDGDSTIYETKFEGAIGVIIGSEGKGIGRLVKENSDFVVNIPMYGKINSLNASVATGIAVYEIVRQTKNGN